MTDRQETYSETFIYFWLCVHVFRLLVLPMDRSMWSTTMDQVWCA